MLGGHYNMVGFDHVALSVCGRNHGLQFENNQIINSNDNIISKIEREDFDCSIMIGTDPISHLPWQVSKKLISKPIILIDNKQSATSNVADVIIPSAITGIECEGLAYRLDHIPIDLNKIVNPPNNILSDEQILKKILNDLKGG
jgi:formylmethanofuran dehydrogenase subunit B